MPFSSRWAILGRMKILASVVALVLVGLTGGWLWVDATAQARQDSEGVVITGAVDPRTATGVVGGAGQQDGAVDASDADGPATDAGATDPGAASGSDRQARLDQVVTLLGSASDRLITRADQERKVEDRAEKKAEEQRKAAEKKAEEERKAAERAEREARRQAEEEAEQRAQPIPVQPAPVSPGGSCEWDDDGWDCDDADDAWDDDDR